MFNQFGENIEMHDSALLAIDNDEDVPAPVIQTLGSNVMVNGRREYWVIWQSPKTFEYQLWTDGADVGAVVRALRELADGIEADAD